MAADEDHHFIPHPKNPRRCKRCHCVERHAVHGLKVDHRGFGLETPSGNYIAQPAPDSDGESDVDLDPRDEPPH